MHYNYTWKEEDGEERQTNKNLYTDVIVIVGNGKPVNSFTMGRNLLLLTVLFRFALPLNLSLSLTVSVSLTELTPLESQHVG